MILIVRRNLLSYQYRRDASKPAAWGNNDANNSLDLLTLYDDTTPLFSCRLQTVSNLEGLDPGVLYQHTLAPGTFQLRFQVPKRAFYCDVNGLCNAKTLGGDTIGPDSVRLGHPDDPRWLNHDWEFPSNTGRPAGQDTRVAWSAGCFVMPDVDLIEFNHYLAQHGVKAGDLVDGILEDSAT